VGGVFVWALEGAFLSLMGWASLRALIALTLMTDGVMYNWATWTVLLSSLFHVMAQVAIASWRLSIVLEHGALAAIAHQTLARAHCCVVFFTTVIFGMVWLWAHSYNRTANIFFSSSTPGTIFAGAALTALLVVILMVAVAGAFAATPVGASNTLFLFSALWILLGALYPLFVEIGQRELFLCSSTQATIAGILLANSILLASYLLFVLDVLEVNVPAAVENILPGSKIKNVRFFRFIHAASVSLWLLVYTISSNTVTFAVWVLFGILAALGFFSSVNALPDWVPLRFLKTQPQKTFLESVRVSTRRSFLRLRPRAPQTDLLAQQQYKKAV
jgi:hypothetical protein